MDAVTRFIPQMTTSFSLERCVDRRSAEKLICCVCHTLTKSLRRISACHHIICVECHKNWGRPICPVCRNPHKALYSDFLLTDLVADMLVTCSCGKEFSLKDMSAHEVECDQVLGTCAFCCTANVSRQDHVCPNPHVRCSRCRIEFNETSGHSCRYDQIKCTRCNESMCRRHVYLHHSFYCRTYVCAYADCKFLASRDEVERHMQTCENRSWQCTYASVGCEFKGQYCDKMNHLMDSALYHEELFAKSHAPFFSEFMGGSTMEIIDYPSSLSLVQSDMLLRTNLHKKLVLMSPHTNRLYLAHTCLARPPP